MQFFSVIQKGELFGQDVINIYWFRRNAVGVPTDADLPAVRDAWATNLWTKMQPVLTTDYFLLQTIVQGYDGNWNRVPYLPRITDYSTTAGQAAGPTAPPLQCAILATRVVPVDSGPKIKKGVRVMVPVRRGYWAISGLPRDGFSASGLMSEAYRTSAPMLAWAAAMNDTFAATTAPEMLEPIKVSQPLKGEVLRGYGLVADAAWRKFTSARASRKVGRGG